MIFQLFKWHFDVNWSKFEKRWADVFQIYPNAIHFNPPQFCPSLSFLSFPVFCLSSSIVLSHYFVVSVNSRNTWSMLKLPKIAWPSPFKELILKGYELVPEAYRQKFRSFEKLGCQTYLEFARSKEQLFDRWCHSQKVDKDHDKLRQLILIGEFERCIHSDVRTFIDEQRAETLEDEARLAEEFLVES